jgi:hemerythrin superfamily protein
MAQRDIIDVLTAEHKDALDHLQQIKSSSDTDTKLKLANTVITALVQHSVVEETFVYPLIAQHLTDGKAKSQQDAEEHHTLEAALRDLEHSDPKSAEFDQITDRLIQILTHHRNAEEQEQFPELRSKVPKEDLMKIVDKAETLKKLAPTHPHPDTHMNTKAFNLAVGPMVGMVDRLRDSLMPKQTAPTS